jgi:hypothetical protein
MKALRIAVVAVLALMVGTLLAHAAEPQVKPSPLVCGMSSMAAPSTEIPQFFSKPKAKTTATEGLSVHVCWITCDRCQSDSDCYQDGYFVGPCEAGFFCQ